MYGYVLIQLRMSRRHDPPLDVPRVPGVSGQRRAAVARGGLRLRRVPRAQTAPRQGVRRQHEHRRRQPRLHAAGILPKIK